MDSSAFPRAATGSWIADAPNGGVIDADVCAQKEWGRGDRDKASIYTASRNRLQQPTQSMRRPPRLRDYENDMRASLHGCYAQASASGILVSFVCSGLHNLHGGLCVLVILP